MTAATITNVQSVIEVKCQLAQTRINDSISSAKVAASEARSQAAFAVKQQASEAVISLTMLVLLAIFAAVALAFSHFNVMLLAKMVPIVLLATVAFGALSLFNPGTQK